jgi:hypothetical protein
MTPNRTSVAAGGLRAAHWMAAAVAAATALPLLIRCWTPIESYDFWWHLTTGAEIVRTGRLPSTDPYSFTAAGVAWVDHSWLFQILIHLLDRSGGFAAVGLLRLALVGTVAAVLVLHLRRCRMPAAAVAATILVCLWGACFRLTVRPDLVSVAFSAVLLSCLIRMRGGGWRPAAAVAALLLPLWSNLHIGAVLGPILIVPFCLEGILYPAADRSARPDRPGSTADRFGPVLRYWALLAWSVPALAVNPWGWKPYAVVARIATITRQAYGANLEWAQPLPGDFPLFYLSLLAVLVLPLWRRGIPDPPVYLAVSMLAVMSLTGIRFVGIYFTAVPFLIGSFVAATGSRTHRPVHRGGWLPAVSGLVAVGLGIGFTAHVLRQHPLRSDFLRRDRFPAGAVEFLAAEGIPAARMFNDVKFGGFLIWSRFPDHRVFIDGRNEVYEDLLREVFTALRSAPAWKRLLDRHGIDSALLRYPPELSAVVYPGRGGAPSRIDARPFSTLYFPREEWALVHWDDAAMLFLKRTPEHDEWIRRWEYEVLRPDDHRHLLRRARSEPGLVDTVLVEIDRKIAEDPDCRRARTLREAFAGVPPPPLTRSVSSAAND